MPGSRTQREGSVSNGDSVIIDGEGLSRCPRSSGFVNVSGFVTVLTHAAGGPAFT